MTNNQIEAWKRVRNVGTVDLVVGWLGVALCVFMVLLAIILAVANFPIDNSDGTSMPSGVLGLIIALIFLIFFLPFAIVNIVAGIKLRKPIAKPRGWVIYSIVIGAISLTSGLTLIPAVLQTVFGVLAVSTLHTIDGTEPPSLEQLNKGTTK